VSWRPTLDSRILGEVGQGGGFGFEGGDGFDEACNGEGVADAAGAADEAQDAAFAGELDGDPHQSGDAGAVNLRDPVQDYDHALRALLNDGLQGVVELVGRLADGEAAMDVENGHVAGIADVDLHGQSFGHVRSRDTFSGSTDPTCFWPAVHYTMAAPRGKTSLAESYTHHKRSEGLPEQCLEARVEAKGAFC
jgi:hypothetical protein